jgi:hypothetical protein
MQPKGVRRVGQTVRDSHTLDLATAAALLSSIGLAAIVTPHEKLILGAPLLHNAVFGVLASVLLFWVLGRLWWLARCDGGPSRLIAFSIAATVVVSVYGELWNLLVFEGPFQAPLDTAIAVLDVAGSVLLAIAFLNWKRMPAWLGWLLVSYCFIEAIEGFTGIMLLGNLPVTLSGVLWSVILACLAIVLLSDRAVREQSRLSVSASNQGIERTPSALD